MCGICGFAPVDPRREVARALIERMAATLRHRGPDGCGFLTGPGVGLGSRRLAIIDLETGDQPITSEDGSATVVCNGEIYNAPELRRSLEATGHRFHTRSDAEVIVHLFEDLGLAFVTRLRGMFALALWDAPNRRLVLARDRFGIKPMVYSTTGSGLWFGSEAKAVLAGGEVAAAMELGAVEDLLTFGFVLTPRTLFAGIRRLPPAHLLVWQDGTATLRRYWQAPVGAERSNLGERAWAEALLAKLEETIRIHLRSDVEVGAWLSPGVDSSGVVSLAQSLLDRPLRTVTLAFADPIADETRTRRTLDTFPGHELPNELAVCDTHSFALFREAVWCMEEPTACMVEIPHLVLAQASARSVKVVLTGEGSDEVFGGYRHVRLNRWTSRFARLPRWLRRGLLPGPIESRHPWAVPLLLAPREMGRERYRRLVGMTHSAELQGVLSPEFRRNLHTLGPGGDWLSGEHRLASLPQFAALHRCEMEVRLPDYILHMTDRAAMAYGLEVRVPFLDHELVELCAGIPPSLKLRAGTEKYILRRALERSLPPEICWRRKRGLTAPSAGWWRSPLPAFAEDLLSEGQLVRNGYFAPATVSRVLRRHRSGEVNLGHILNLVLAVQVWHSLFLDGSGPGASLALD
jgi:asparagine synthase (glutamine-hydrolysing)